MKNRSILICTSTNHTSTLIDPFVVYVIICSDYLNTFLACNARNQWCILGQSGIFPSLIPMTANHWHIIITNDFFILYKSLTAGSHIGTLRVTLNGNEYYADPLNYNLDSSVTYNIDFFIRIFIICKLFIIEVQQILIEL